MATSGVYNLELETNEVLEQALRNLQVSGDGEPITGDMYNRARDKLNIMLKAWEGQGIHLWTYEEGTLFLEKGRAEYPFGDSTVHVANDYIQTTTDADEAIGQTVISVTSTTGFAINNPIGILTEDNNLFWSTIASFVAEDTVTINDALTVAASSGAIVYTYALNSFKPVSRISATRRKEPEDYEVPINHFSREDYENLPNKNQNGTVIQTYYRRHEPTGTMFVWNPPASARNVIRFSYERRNQIMVTATNTFDLPEYWYEPVVYNLSVRLIPEFGCTPARQIELKEMARESLDVALGYDTAIYPITVNMRQH